MNAILILIAILISINSCGRAIATDRHVETLTASDGAHCYVIVEDGKSIGANCI